MAKELKVIIDGVIYVPLMDSNKDMDAIARGVLRDFWGELPKGMTLDRAMDGISVIVTDDGTGTPIDEFLSGIAKELNK